MCFNHITAKGPAGKQALFWFNPLLCHYKPASRCHPERREGSATSTNASLDQPILRGTQDDMREGNAIQIRRI